MRPAGNGGDLLVPVFEPAHPAHELEVIDHHQIHAALDLEPAELGPDVQDRLQRAVVDVDGVGGELVDLERHLGLLALGDRARPEALEIHAAGHAQEAEEELLGAHFQAEKGHRFPVLGDVEGQAEREGGLAHRGPGGEDDEVALLEPRGHVVEIGEVGGDPRDVFAALGELTQEALHLGRQDVHALAGWSGWSGRPR